LKRGKKQANRRLLQLLPTTTATTTARRLRSLNVVELVVRSTFAQFLHLESDPWKRADVAPSGGFVQRAVVALGIAWALYHAESGTPLCVRAIAGRAEEVVERNLEKEYHHLPPGSVRMPL